MQKIPIVKEELIGKIVKIKDCRDPNWIGKTGIIIDETKNTFLIEIKNQQRRIAKNIATFEFKHQEEKIIVEGSQLTYKPENRIKKAR